MRKKIEALLPHLEKPSRYLGCEINSVIKNDEKVKLHFLLAFPDVYEVGMSHFGIQILYDILNKIDEVFAERVFAPPEDLEEKLRKKDIPLFSLETKRDLKSFDIIGFSLLYELNYTNILLMLDLANIPFLAKDRDGSFPLIIAGGPSCFNPEPIADFFDVIVIGDGENVIKEISSKYIEHKSKNKNELLEKLSKIRGVYVPSFFEIKNKTLVPKKANYTKIKKALIPKFEKEHIKQIVPFGKPIHDRLRLEICRGCSAGCRFCQAGIIYRPVREKNLDDLLEYTKKAISETGYTDISLLSLSTGEYSNLAPLINKLSKEKNLSVSLPSIRANKLNKNLMEHIKSVRKTGFTIAPEAGSQRLRDVINKKISEKEILKTVEEAFLLGWKVIKLYFMIGLPTETMDDIDEIVTLTQKLAKHKKQINISITVFVPKPHTPFQYEAQITKKTALKRIYRIKDGLKNLRFIKLSYTDPDSSELEAIVSRGGREISSLILKAYQNGAKFDAWNEKFNFSVWQNAIETLEIDTSYVHKKMDDTKSTIWEHIDSLVSKKFLIEEKKKALKKEHTGNCIYEECSKCGVCDFKEIKPILFKKKKQTNEQVFAKEDDYSQQIKHKKKLNYEKILFSFSKKDNARFFGHLELINIFVRAFVRAGINLKHSQGFHPLPKISFLDTLPLGMESLKEEFYCFIPENIELSTSTILEKMNEKLPNGLKINAYKKIVEKKDIKFPDYINYILFSKKPFDEIKFNKFKKVSNFFIEKKTKKGIIKEIDIKPLIKNITLKNENLIIIKTKNSLRPKTFLKKALGICFENIRVIKLSQ